MSLNRIRYAIKELGAWEFIVIDADGYRHNIAIVLFNRQGKVLFARRHGQHAWQFSQGGVHSGEMPLLALYRELYEELGLRPSDVCVESATIGWLRYELPLQFRRMDQKICIGQKQKWFLLRLLAPDSAINLNATFSPEFDRWRWVDYWYPLGQVISFKRHVYRKALERFYPLVLRFSRQRNNRYLKRNTLPPFSKKETSHD